MLIIGVAGGTGAGKSTLVKHLMERLPIEEVILIPQDNYYKDNGHISIDERKKLNFDHPTAIEFDLLVEHLKSLKSKHAIEMPTYSYLTCTRDPNTVHIEPREVIIVEGILVMTNEKLRKMFDIKVFVDADADQRLIRCIHRDIFERGRSVKEVLDRYEQTVKPMHDTFIEPSKRFADIIFPQGGRNEVAIHVLAELIQSKLQKNYLAKFNRTPLSKEL